MSKEITVTANVQITAISKMGEEQYEESMEYINGFWGGLDGWKAKTAKELSDFIKAEVPADDAVVTDVKMFIRDIDDKEDTDEDSTESL